MFLGGISTFESSIRGAKFFSYAICLLCFRRKADTVKGRGPESVRRGSRDANNVPTPEFDDEEDTSSLQVCSWLENSHVNLKRIFPLKG